MTWPIAGLIEGFYGRPWSWGERVDVARWCAARGMRHYVYAPKDDPLHRRRWRDAYPPAELDGFRRLAAEGGLDVGFGISPGLSIDWGSTADRDAVWTKVEAVLGTGAVLVVLALDDLPPDPSRSPARVGSDHAELTTWLHRRLDGRAALVLVPTEYVGVDGSPYLTALADGLPDDVPVGWTGVSVVNDRVTAEEAGRRAAALGGRRPLLWDNVPVNDGVMADRLFLGPLRGRDPALADACTGYLANVMVQPRASMLPLASIAAWLAGDDPAAAWTAAADHLGWRTFAEACDGEVPRRLVGALAAEGGGRAWRSSAVPLARWLDDAARCGAPNLEDEAGPWLEQVRTEAAVALDALRLYAATKPAISVAGDGSARAAPVDPDDVVLRAFAVMVRWPGVRRGDPSVMGLRYGFRPALGQRADGGWSVRPDVLQHGGNAVDHLVELALEQAAAVDAPEPLRVTVDGTDVQVPDDGSFTAPPGAVVVARCGTAATEVRGPTEPVLPEPRR